MNTLLGKYVLIYFSILSALFASCRVDPPLDSGCEMIAGSVNDVYPDKVFRNAPVSNPLNGNEFAYVAEDSEITGIWKYNIASNSKELIIEFDVWEVPDWSTTDWLVFGSGQQLFKCKSNGDSLIQLTFINENYDPSWSPDGKEIVFWRRDAEANFRTVIMNKDGIIIDSLESITGYPCSWSPDGEKIAFVTHSISESRYTISYIKLSEPDNLITLEQSNVGSTHELLDWYPDSKRLVYAAENLESINIESGEIELILHNEDCYNYYIYHTVLADGKSIISNWLYGNYDQNSNTFYHDYDLIQILPGGIITIISDE